MKEKIYSALQSIYPQEDLELIKYNMPFRTSHEVYFVDFRKDNSKERLVFKLFPNNIPGYKNPNLGKEVEVIRGLKNEGSVEVPEVIYYNPSNDIFGREFFALEWLEGIPISQFISSAKTLNEKKQYVKECAELVARIHNVDTSYFPSLTNTDYYVKTIENLRKLYEELNKSGKKLRKDDLMLMKNTISFLEQNRPRETDDGLINGDLSTNHFLLSEGKYYIIDWDPAEIGDRSWDLYWMIKDIPSVIFGYDEALDDLITFYEDASKSNLKNKKFYSQAALSWAHILGWYIEEKIPDHEVVPLIKQCRSGFENKLENLLSK